jgi:hypothetical protein
MEPMICIFCGKEAPVAERWSRTDEETGRARQVMVQNHPVCGSCMVKIQERMNENEAIRRRGVE